MKLKTFINILVILLMGYIFFPPLSIYLNTRFIPGFPINLFQKLYIVILLHISIFAYYPKVFTLKPMLYVYAYYLVFYLFRISGYYDTESQWFGGFHFSIYIATLLYSYYLYRKDFKGLATVVTSILIIIIFASFMNFIQLLRHPSAVRMTAGKAGAEMDFYYVSMGIAGYNFISTIPLLFPVLVWLYKFKFIKSKYKKYLFPSIIIVFLSIYVSSISVPILISLIGLFVAFAGRNNLIRSIFISFIIMLPIIIIPTQVLSGAFYSISTYISNSNVSSRFYDIGLAIDYGIDTDDPDSGLEQRAQRVPLNIKQFVKYPIFGKGEEGNAHLFWLNYLAQFGIIGTLFLVLILYTQIKTNVSIFSQDFIFFYLLSISLFLLLGFLKAYPRSVLFETILFLVPGIYSMKVSKNG